MAAEYQFGIEEEFFLADASTRGTPGRAAKAFHRDVKAAFPEAERELLRSQIETASPPTRSFAEARAALTAARTTLAEIGRIHGILLLASGTHPTARWARQSTTQKDRYQRFMREMQMVEARNMVCGMHVHVEVPRPDERRKLVRSSFEKASRVSVGAQVRHRRKRFRRTAARPDCDGPGSRRPNGP